MRYFKLGKHNVSKYCLGTWSLGGNKNKNISYGSITVSEVNQILDYACESGINFFDTANVYGDAEKKLGNFFSKTRDKVFIATKVGCVSFKKKLNFSKKIVKSQIYNSLKNLKSEYVDIVQLYNPNYKDRNLNYTIEYLDKLKSQKKISFIGISLAKPEDYIQLRKLYKFDTIQFNFNPLDQRAISKEFKNKINKDKIKIFARTILNFGIFTEKFLKKKDIQFYKDDHRYYWNEDQIMVWLKYIKKIKAYSKRPIENTCYRFCNSFNLDSLIIGATNRYHIIKAVEKKNYSKLSKDEIKFFKKVYGEYSTQRIFKPKIAMKSI